MNPLKDLRVIEALVMPGPSEARFQVGSCGVTQILAESVPGECAYVTWFAVWCGDVLSRRINAAHVAEVEYEATTT